MEKGKVVRGKGEGGWLGESCIDDDNVARYRWPQFATVHTLHIHAALAADLSKSSNRNREKQKNREGVGEGDSASG